MNQSVDILRRAREILSAPGSWTQHAPARNRNGTATDPTSEFACCWCTMGAIHRGQVDGHHKAAAAAKAHRAVTTLVNLDIPHLSVAGWNDHPERTHADVLKLLDRAIRALEPAS